MRIPYKAKLEEQIRCPLCYLAVNSSCIPFSPVYDSTTAVLAEAAELKIESNPNPNINLLTTMKFKHEHCLKLNSQFKFKFKVNIQHSGAQVAEWLARRSLTNAARVRFPAGDLIPAP